jgi:protein-ribulosamine 3-kinase
MPIPDHLIERLSALLGQHAGVPVTIRSEVPITGGSIHDAYRLATNVSDYFVKVSSTDGFPSMFEVEADGLGRLRTQKAVRVPATIAFGEEQDQSFLLLEHIASGPKTGSFWEDLGRSLARLHRSTQERFGLERDNYIGSLKQVNTVHDRWADFFIHCRLEPHVKMARDKDRIGMGDVLRFERLYAKLPSLFPIEPPALLHGDLWNGNILCEEQGRAVLVDPAVYYGHREMDVAMTKLFGGSDAVFYSAYNDEWPMEKGWEERADLCNLYPLMVHVNLFGAKYVAQMETLLKRFV